MKLSDVLKLAKTKIETGWCQGSLAISTDGRGVAPTDKDACKWCSLGAIQSAVGSMLNKTILSGLDWKVVCDAREMLRTSNELGAISPWNDESERTQAEIASGFDKAIKSAEDAGL